LALTPKRHQSGTSIDYEGRITKQGDINVREALCEAAASLLMRVRTWSALPSDCEANEHDVRNRCRRAQARRRPASHVDRGNRLQDRLRRQGDAEAETEAGAVIDAPNRSELLVAGYAVSPLKRSKYRDPRAR
jgi:transposase